MGLFLFLMIEFEIYSPIEEITLPVFEQHKVRVFLKRDDMIHPFISGNKWRKLKYNLIKAQQQDKNHLITFGGAWSNHLLATACAAARFGFKSTAFVRGEDLNNEALFLCRTFGMKMIFTDRESYRDKHILFKRYFGNDDSAYFIDEGGAGEEAALGCSEIISELTDTYDHIFVAAGTGTTAAGIINGVYNQQRQTKVQVVSVLKGDFLGEEIQKLGPLPDQFSLHTDYHFGGYAKTKPELLEFIQMFASSTGILLDPVYTGKMMFALTDLISKSEFPAGTRILAIHTGGIFALLGMKEKFNF